MVGRYIKDGKVAVIYSPGYGAGWSSWNHDIGEEAVFCPEMAKLIDVGDIDGAMRFARDRWPHAYHGGVADGLELEWVEPGSRIEMYDGKESVRVLGPSDGYVA